MIGANLRQCGSPFVGAQVHVKHATTAYTPSAATIMSKASQPELKKVFGPSIYHFLNSFLP